MERAKLRDFVTGKIVDVHATTEHDESSCGQPVWIDEDGVCYGQCGSGAPVGFEFAYDDDRK